MGSQFPALDKPTLAQTLGLDPANVSINVMLAGGSFGRRAQPTAHVAAEIGEIANAAGGDGAWKLMFTRRTTCMAAITALSPSTGCAAASTPTETSSAGRTWWRTSRSWRAARWRP